MAKFLYSAAMSLDGFISGPGGDMSWMVDYLGPNPVVDQLIKQTGAILVGNRTFGGDDPYKGKPGEGEVFGGGWDGPQFVWTHRPPAEQVPGVMFVGNIETAVAESRAAAGDKYVNILGASVAAQCLDAGVLDEVLVSVLPVLLGDGTRLFEQPGGKTVRLEQISVTHTQQITDVWYRQEEAITTTARTAATRTAAAAGEAVAVVEAVVAAAVAVGEAHDAGCKPPLHRITRASTRTPSTICDSLRLAYPSINPGGAVSGSA